CRLVYTGRAGSAARVRPAWSTRHSRTFGLDGLRGLGNTRASGKSGGFACDAVAGPIVGSGRSVVATGAAERDLEWLASHFLPGFLLVSSQNGTDLGHGFLAHGLHLLADLLEVAAPETAGEHLLPFVLGVAEDRLDLAFLLVCQAELLLDLGVGEGVRAALL